MPMVDEGFLLQLLQACASVAPLYPQRFAREHNLDRDKLDVGLEELRRRGLLRLTDWMQDLGQGYALTAAGEKALTSGQVPTGRAAPAAPVSEGPLTEYQRGELVRNAIFEPTPPYVSRVLLAANLLYFAFGAFHAWNNDVELSRYLSEPPTKVLIELGALDPAAVFVPHRLEGEEYGPRPQFERILLSAFLHIGVLHLFMNMYFLYSLGPMIESMWGSVRYVAIYFVAGIVGGCVPLQLDLYFRERHVSAGASGCLFGIFAGMVVWFWLNRRFLPERLFQDWSRNLATNAFLLLAINFLPGISWQGHLGGAIGGFLAALLLHVQRFHPSPAIRWLALVVLPIVPLAFFLALLWQAGYF
jgi:membrane associated rhomboid family serine protease